MIDFKDYKEKRSDDMQSFTKASIVVLSVGWFFFFLVLVLENIHKF